MYVARLFVSWPVVRENRAVGVSITSRVSIEIAQGWPCYNPPHEAQAPKGQARSKARVASSRGGAPSRLRTFAHAIDQADKLLLALGRGTNDDQQALRVVLEPGLHVDAVDPEVHVAFGGEIAFAPARVLVRPSVFKPGDGRGREPAGILAKQRQQCLLEVARATMIVTVISHLSVSYSYA